MPKKHTTSERSYITLRIRPVWFNLILVVLCFFSLVFVRQYVNNPITGDEPHYLLMTYSLIHDHDLNLKNNYENGDSNAFYPGLSPKLQVGPGQGDGRTMRWYSIHEIGIPLLLIPGMWLGGQTGAVITMILCATVTLVLLFLWTYELTKSRKYSYLTAGSLLVAYSYAGLAGYIYPDIIIAGVSLACLLIITKHYQKAWWQVFFGFLLGALLLLNFKSITIAAPLLMALTYTTWHRDHKLPWPALVSFVPIVLYFFISNHAWFGVWNPTHIYAGLTFPNVSPPAIIVGFLFDSMRGLLVYNPLLLLVCTGLPVWFKKSRETCLLTLLVVFPSAAVLATFKGWQGGDSQIGRYAIDFLPLVLPAIAFTFLALKQKWQRICAHGLILLSAVITIISVWIRRTYVRSDLRSPFFAKVEQSTGIAFDRLLPTMNEQSHFIYTHDRLKAVAGVLLVLACFVIGWYISKTINTSGAKKRRSRAPAKA